MAILTVLHSGVARLKPLAMVLAWILAVITLVEISGSWLFRARPNLLWMQGWENPDEQQRLVSEIASFEHYLALEPKPSPFLLVTGLSTAREGIDNTILGSALGLQVLNLGSSGGSFQELDYYTRCLDRIDLRPSLIVIGMHSSWMAGRRPPSPRAKPDRAFSLSTRLNSLKQRVFLYSQFRRIHNSLHNALLAKREELDNCLGLNSRIHLFQPYGLNPIHANYLYAKKSADSTFIAAQLEAFESIGWFDSKNYIATWEEAKALHDILLRTNSICSRVIVVLMPESEAFRDRIPVKAKTSLIETLDGHVAEILDAREILSRDSFYDSVHLNQSGRAQLSEWLAVQIETRNPASQ